MRALANAHVEYVPESVRLQHMVQAALYALMEKQVNELHAEIVDEQPQYLS